MNQNRIIYELYLNLIQLWYDHGTTMVRTEYWPKHLVIGGKCRTNNFRLTDNCFNPFAEANGKGYAEE